MSIHASRSAHANTTNPYTYGNRHDTDHISPDSQDAMNAYLHAELQRIDDLVNDVEMQGPLLEELTFIVLDTNIVLHHLEAIDHFVTDIENTGLPVMVIIPGIVINELDGQKNRDGLAWFARRASAWLLKKVQQRKCVKGQSLEETCKPSRNWKARESGQEFGTERANDGLILDCCKYFLRVRMQRAFLCSADKNLCFEAESESIHTISPNRSRHWGSRDIANIVFGHAVDLSKFASHSPSYHLSAIIDTNAPQPYAYDDNSMDIDDEDCTATAVEVLQPSHALDLLHIQVIEHFTRLLVELVGRVGGFSNTKQVEGGTMLSLYAPRAPQTGYMEWDAPQCLEYLYSHRRSFQSTIPRVEIFLARPYTRRGARRGQDWSRRDWDNALDALARIGDSWQEGYIRESIAWLMPIMETVFRSRMRPTGI